MKRKLDPLATAFIKFWKSEGVKFIDSETGKELEIDDNRTNDSDEEDKRNAA